MANNMFERKPVNIEGAFQADKAKLLFTGTGVTGALVQGMNFTYGQQVTRLYEIGNAAAGATTNVYYVGGRTQGTGGLNRVIGPSATIKALYTAFGDVCKACDNVLTLDLTESNCCSNGGSQQIIYELKGVVLTQVGISLQAADMIINEQAQLMFSDLTYA